MKTRETEAFY